MPPSPFRTFHYHANAHVVSATFTRPLPHVVEVQGASSLPTIGGHGKGRVEDFRFEHFLSVKRGYTHVSGTPQEVEVEVEDKVKGKTRVKQTHFTTLVTAVAEGVNILDVVTADRIVARLASNRTLDDEEYKEPHFTLIGSKFENLQIGGCAVEVPLDIELFEKIHTFELATNEFKNNADFRKMAEDPFERRDKQPEQPVHGAILCSIVDLKKMKKCPGVERKGHTFIIPKFGNLFLGEVLLQHGRRTLTMVRFELGSPVSGSGTVVQLDSNGSPYPPTG
jgi:ribosomal protein L35AE/L33A